MTEQIDYKARRKLLIDALESNEYTQRKGMMRDQDGCMCIQGVVCEVYRQHSGTSLDWVSDWVSDSLFLLDDGVFEMKFDNEWSAPSDRVFEWFGFKNLSDLREALWRPIPSEITKFQIMAVYRNDREGWTFQQFADELKRIDA